MGAKRFYRTPAKKSGKRSVPFRTSSVLIDDVDVNLSYYVTRSALMEEMIDLRLKSIEDILAGKQGGGRCLGVNLKEETIARIDAIIDAGVIRSRSEFMRAVTVDLAVGIRDGSFVVKKRSFDFRGAGAK